MARTRGVGRFTVLSACHIEKNRYECFVDVWNTKVYTSRYYRYVGTSVYFFCLVLLPDMYKYMSRWKWLSVL